MANIYTTKESLAQLATLGFVKSTVEGYAEEGDRHVAAIIVLQGALDMARNGADTSVVAGLQYPEPS
jgi:hypothetical protein